MSRDFSSHNAADGSKLEIDRDGNRLILTMVGAEGDCVSAKFSESEAEEIAGAVKRVYDNIRLRTS